MSATKIERTIENNLEGLKKIENQGLDAASALTTQRLRVALRVRPLLPKDLGREVVVHAEKPDMSSLADAAGSPEGKQTLRLTDMTHHVKSTYDRVFDAEAKQDDVFAYVQNCVANVVNGFNCTIFAYG